MYFQSRAVDWRYSNVYIKTLRNSRKSISANEIHAFSYLMCLITHVFKIFLGDDLWVRVKIIFLIFLMFVPGAKKYLSVSKNVM